MLQIMPDAASSLALIAHGLMSNQFRRQFGFDFRGVFPFAIWDPPAFFRTTANLKPVMLARFWLISADFEVMNDFCLQLLRPRDDALLKSAILPQSDAGR
jgi:hypothetical protein